MNILIRRAYELSDRDTGYRVLVDRLWPRGIKKENLVFDEWCKDIAPSVKLRQWFGHDPSKFDEFSALYLNELYVSPVPQNLLERAKGSTQLILIYGAKDPQINHALVLKKYLESL